MKLNSVRIVTFDQIEFGKLIGLDLAGQSIGVATARIQDEIRKRFWAETELGSPSEKQIELARKFGFEIVGQSRSVGSAIIDDIMHHLNTEAIQTEKLAPGVRVRRKRERKEEYVISSISENGTVFFKGGNGKRAWARNLERAST